MSDATARRSSFQLFMPNRAALDIALGGEVRDRSIGGHELHTR
jgi:hypothetical protein